MDLSFPWSGNISRPANLGAGNSVDTRDVQLTFALKTLFKALVTTVALLSRTLGIGPNVAIFSLFRQVILRPLPVPRAGNGSISARRGAHLAHKLRAVGRLRNFSDPMFRDIEKHQTRLLRADRLSHFGADAARVRGRVRRQVATMTIAGGIDGLAPHSSRARSRRTARREWTQCGS